MKKEIFKPVQNKDGKFAIFSERDGCYITKDREIVLFSSGKEAVEFKEWYKNMYFDVRYNIIIATTAIMEKLNKFVQEQEKCIPAPDESATAAWKPEDFGIHGDIYKNIMKRVTDCLRRMIQNMADGKSSGDGMEYSEKIVCFFEQVADGIDDFNYDVLVQDISDLVAEHILNKTHLGIKNFNERLYEDRDCTMW